MLFRLYQGWSRFTKTITLWLLCRTRMHSRIIHGVREDRHVRLKVDQVCQRPVRVAEEDADADGRVGALECCDHFGGVEWPDCRQAQVAGTELSIAGQQLVRLLAKAQQTVCDPGQCLTRGSQIHLPALAQRRRLTC